MRATQNLGRFMVLILLDSNRSGIKPGTFQFESPRQLAHMTCDLSQGPAQPANCVEPDLARQVLDEEPQ